MEFESIDEQLHHLALTAKAYPVTSRQRQRALTQIVQILQQPDLLRTMRRRGITEDLWKEALQSTLIYVIEKIDNYDPNKGRSFLAWVNSHLKWRQQDAEVRFNRSDTISLESLLSSSDDYQNWEEKISALSYSHSDSSSAQLTYQVILKERSGRNQCYDEVLAEGVLPLRMMQIPAGTFLMGSPEEELDRDPERESPQHQVTLSQFFMAKYPVTQAQWRVVAAMEPVNLELEPDPSHFKGDLRPVEQVSWHDAVEFCDRLTRYTNRQYRLPSEAEWEYACRAGTTTPFHFGETITTAIANYRGIDDESSGDRSGSYGDGSKGIYRAETTPVDHFGIANAFGLCDLHGNILEWCADYWHENYEGAPTDGSAWIEGGDSSKCVIHGGSWINSPRDCRSAYRYDFNSDIRLSLIGFRVCCAALRKRATAPRALQ